MPVFSRGGAHCAHGVDNDELMSKVRTTDLGRGTARDFFSWPIAGGVGEITLPRRQI